MDMITVDLTDLPQCGVGTPVEFWGTGIDINEVAARAGTISYELLCNVKRDRKVYRGGLASWSESVKDAQYVAHCGRP